MHLIVGGLSLVPLLFLVGRPTRVLDLLSGSRFEGSGSWGEHGTDGSWGWLGVVGGGVRL